MRAVVQRVNFASVEFEDDGVLVKNEIKKGLQVLLGVANDDTEKDVDYLIDKIVGLRIFEDENEKMNLSLKDIGGEILLVSQFTLYGDVRKGKRPNFSESAKPDLAEKLYEKMIEKIRAMDVVCETGKFGADMTVNINNDGPVTILLDSKKLF